LCNIVDITGKLARKIEAGRFAPGRNSIVIKKGSMQQGIYLLKMNAGIHNGFTKVIVK